MVRNSIKAALTYVGARCSPWTIFALNAVVNYLAVGQWMKAHHYVVPKRFEYRAQIFEIAASQIANKDTLYLEFGVYEGYATRFWSQRLTNPHAKLHGFDSFEGLPDRWNPLYGPGALSRGGRMPSISDPRVRFFKGWFEDTLPGYVVPEHEVLFANVDCDTFSSTRTVLRFLAPHLSEGDYLYFDEFHYREHELRAFEELVTGSPLRFEVLAADRGLGKVLFRCLGPGQGQVP